MATMIRKKIKKLTEKKGLATVETAVIIMLLALMTFGAMEYGWMFVRMQQMSNVAREAARTAALPDMGTGDVQARVDSLMGSWGMDSFAYTTVIYPSSITTLNPGTPVTVTVTVPYDGGAQLMGLPIIPLPADLTSSATMATEGP